MTSVCTLPACRSLTSSASAAGPAGTAGPSGAGYSTVAPTLPSAQLIGSRAEKIAIDRQHHVGLAVIDAGGERAAEREPRAFQRAVVGQRGVMMKLRLRQRGRDARTQIAQQRRGIRLDQKMQPGA